MPEDVREKIQKPFKQAAELVSATPWFVWRTTSPRLVG